MKKKYIYIFERGAKVLCIIGSVMRDHKDDLLPQTKGSNWQKTVLCSSQILSIMNKYMFPCHNQEEKSHLNRAEKANFKI